MLYKGCACLVLCLWALWWKDIWSNRRWDNNEFCKMKGTSEVHLAHPPAIKRAYALQAQTEEILPYFMFWGRRKRVNWKKPQYSTHSITKYIRMPKYIKFDYHEGQRMLLTDKVILIYHLSSYTEFLSVTAHSSTLANKFPARSRRTHTYTDAQSYMYTQC